MAQARSLQVFQALLIVLSLLITASSSEGDYILHEEDPSPPLSSRRNLRADRPHPGAANSVHWCGTPTPDAASKKAKEANILTRTRGRAGMPSTFVVPVHFWIVYYKKGASTEGYVSPQQIKQQMQVLNSAFAGQLKGVGNPKDDGTPFGSVPVQFILAGTHYLPTSNYSKYDFDPSEPPEYELRAKYRVGGCETLNVFTHAAKSSGILGISAFPWECLYQPQFDGIFLEVGSLPGGSQPINNLGRILPHEAGHWVGLYHTFQDSCSVALGGDYVADTPYEFEPAYGCRPQVDSCSSPGKDPIRNMMDYGDDPCRYKFTPKQGARVRYVMSASRFFNSTVTSKKPPPATAPRRPPPPRPKAPASPKP